MYNDNGIQLTASCTNVSYIRPVMDIQKYTNEFDCKLLFTLCHRDPY